MRHAGMVAVAINLTFLIIMIDHSLHSIVLLDLRLSSGQMLVSSDDQEVVIVN